MGKVTESDLPRVFAECLNSRIESTVLWTQGMRKKWHWRFMYWYLPFFLDIFFKRGGRGLRKELLVRLIYWYAGCSGAPIMVLDMGRDNIRDGQPHIDLIFGIVSAANYSSLEESGIQIIPTTDSNVHRWVDAFIRHNVTLITSILKCPSTLFHLSITVISWAKLPRTCMDLLLPKISVDVALSFSIYCTGQFNSCM